MLDLIVLSVPVIEPVVPTPGIYYIKGSAEQAGFSAVAKDLNLWFNDSLPTEITKFDYYFIANSSLINIDENNELYIRTVEMYRQYLELHVTPNESRYIGISIFSVHNLLPAYILCKLLKQLYPTRKIIAGGNGVEDTAPGNKDLGAYFKSIGIVDHVVYGEGEEAIQALLAGKYHPNIDVRATKTAITNLDSIAVPNYSDLFLDFPHYDRTAMQLPIIGSRGCVRDCTFCNVNSIWPSFRYRSGKSIAREMINNYELYGVNRFAFSDSLINGSMHAFRDLCTTMAEYRTADPDRDIGFHGQFICRSQRQMPPSDFKLMHAAGFVNAAIGIEAGSERVRNDIKKGFSQEDMYYTLDNLLDNNIGILMMFIVGYPTETDEDFEESIKLVERYADRKELIRVKVGKTLRLLHDTPLTNDFTHLYYYDDNPVSDWVSTVVPDLNFEKRVERAKRLKDTIQRLGYDNRMLENDIDFLDNRVDRRRNIQ